MQIAVRPRFAAGIASLGMLMAVALTLPGVASADTISCRGHTQLATASDDFDNPLDYSFGCTGRIVGYMILSKQELNGFTNDVTVIDSADKLIPSDGFQCEGDIPGNGFGCVGTYSTNGTVKGTFDVSERAACAEPRVQATLVVVAETIDPITGVAKKSSLGAMGGPFDLGRPQGCPKSGVLRGLLAEIALLRAGLVAS